MKRFFLIVIMVLFIKLPAFATINDSTMDRVMKSWVGENINSVIDVWGYPSFEKIVADRKLYYWSNGNSISEDFWETKLIEKELCTKIFEVDKNNIIIKWQWKGTDCPNFYCTSKYLVNPRNNPWEKSRECKKFKKKFIR